VRKTPRANDDFAKREDVGADSELLALPRYEPFTAAVMRLAAEGVRFVEIAGNERILATLVVPAGWHDAGARGERLLEWPILTEPARKRVAVTLDVARLHEVLPSLVAEPGVTLDHLYDF
jgi:hypothetical protein